MHSVFIILFISKLTWDLNIAKELIYDMNKLFLRLYYVNINRKIEFSLSLID
jgi:hypothetical protein